MKEATLHSLITAKALFDDATHLCASGSTHAATAGLILLQDALELVLLAALVEADIDDASKTEKLSFDQIIGDLRAGGIDVPKSGTLKSLNKNRVLAKHYGQLILPEAVRGYLEASKITIDVVLQQVVGQSLDDVFLTDLLDEGEAKILLRGACDCLKRGAYFEALVEVRKAIFVEIEQQYSVYEWGNPQASPFSLAMMPSKAPSYARNKEWIASNVKEPTNYVVIDLNQMRADGVEWGVNTNELLNLRWLTPNVFRSNVMSPWCVSHDIALPANQATQHNAQYCLDRAISIIAKKQTHQRALRYPLRTALFSPPPLYVGSSVYLNADTGSQVVHIIAADYLYTVTSRVTGFDGYTKLYRVHGQPSGEPNWSTKSIYGFLVDPGANVAPFMPIPIEVGASE